MKRVSFVTAWSHMTSRNARVVMIGMTRLDQIAIAQQSAQQSTPPKTHAGEPHAPGSCGCRL
eukprot:1083082-Prymnesium_polylepis.1